MRTNFAQVRTSSIPAALSFCATDARLPRYVNEAQRRLLNRGNWWGTFQLAQFCVTKGCLTWPREIATIEAVSLCSKPVNIRNMWYEFLGPVDYPNSCCSTDKCDNVCNAGDPCSLGALQDRGVVPAFEDITGTGKKIMVQAAHSSDNGKRILLQGIDNNGLNIRTQDGALWVDGEYVILNTASILSANTFSTLTGVQKDATNMSVRIYQYDVATSTIEKNLAVYQPDELIPQYRRSYILSLSSACASGCSCAKGTHQVNAVVKLEFIPALVDTDWLIIGNLDALKFMAMSIYKEERGDMAGAEGDYKRAIRELVVELDTRNSRKTTVRVSGHAGAPLSRIFAGFN